MLWLNPDRGGNRNPAFKQHNCGDAHHAEAGCKLRLLVDIDPCRHTLRRCVPRPARRRPREHAARAAPGAQKSTSTGFSAARTSRSKLSCVTVKTDILKTPFASDDIASPVYIHRICQNACSFRDNITILWVWIKLVSASSPSPDEQASAHLRSQRPRARVQPRLPPENI